MPEYSFLPTRLQILLALLENQRADKACFLGGLSRLLNRNVGTIHRDGKVLEREGLIKLSTQGGGSPVFFSLTPEGEKSANDLLAEHPGASFGLCPSPPPRRPWEPRTRPPAAERSATLEILGYIHERSNTTLVDVAIVVANTGWSRQVVQRVLEWLFIFDLLSRTGQGVKANPWKYLLSPAGRVLMDHLTSEELEQHLGQLAANLLSTSSQR